MPILNMIAQGSGGGGGNIGEPLNLTVTTIGLDATITWEDNEIGTIPPTTFQKSELVRKIGSAPTSPSDGDLIVTETVKDTYKTTGYVDQGLTDGETYYYRVFSYSDLGGISYCDAESVTISTKWQPGANTMIYYTWDNSLADQSGNSRDATSGGTVSYGTHYIDLASGYLSFPNLSYSNPTTILIWFKCNSSSGGYIYDIVNSGVGVISRAGTNGVDISIFSDRPSYQPYYFTYNTDWNLLTAVFDSSGIKYYVNGTLGATKTAWGTGQPYTASGSKIGTSWNDSAVNNPQLYCGYFIIENKARTATEISEYYNQTKGDYGIS